MLQYQGEEITRDKNAHNDPFLNISLLTFDIPYGLWIIDGVELLCWLCDWILFLDLENRISIYGMAVPKIT